jgi:parallel beta-helix repeat protein
MGSFNHQLRPIWTPGTFHPQIRKITFQPMRRPIKGVAIGAILVALAAWSWLLSRPTVVPVVTATSVGTMPVLALDPTGAGPRPFEEPAVKRSDVSVTPMDDVRALVSAAAPGTVFRFAPGRYQRVEIEVGADMTFVGGPGVIFDGSTPVTAFTPEALGWRAASPISGSTEPAQNNEWGYCDDGRPECVFPEDLFVDGIALERVDRAGLVGSGKWFFDTSGNTILIGDDPAGKDVSIGTAKYAFWGDADGVTIIGFEITRYATPGRQGAINPRIGRTGPSGKNWVVTGNTLSWNHAWGVKVEDGMTIADNRIDRNGQGGIGGVGDDLTIVHNEVSSNCTAGYRCLGFEGGAMKLEGVGISIRFNSVVGNLGHGIHTDRGCADVVVEGNVVTDNEGAGIHHEISGDARIADNIVIGNGFRADGAREPGILVLSSANVTVARNEVKDNADGIVLRQDGRTDLGILADVEVASNLVTLSPGSSVAVSGSLGATLGPSWGARVTFRSNHYRFAFDPEETPPFRWRSSRLDPLGWRGLGLDTDGTFERTSE